MKLIYYIHKHALLNFLLSTMVVNKVQFLNNKWIILILSSTSAIFRILFVVYT